MAIRDFFQKGIPKVKSAETLESAFDLAGVEIESSDYASERSVEKTRFVPDVDYSSASNFAHYGSAEEYYRQSFKRIYQQYPYDGTRAERTKFDNESTFLDRYIFDKIYPRTTGYAVFSPSGWGTLSSPGTALTGGYGLSDSLEYIKVIGGPHTSSGGMIGKDLRSAFGDPTYRTSPSANKYDTDIYSTEGLTASGRSGTRESNLRFDLSTGVSTEFWFNKGTNGDTAASTTITMTVADIDKLGAGDIISLITTDGKTITCTLQAVGGTTTSAATDGNVTAATFAAATANVAQATSQADAVATAINNNNYFTATNDANVVTVTQADKGLAGNTIVTITEIGTNIIDMAGAGSNNDRFKVNIPTALGGTGNDITIRVVSPADPSDGTANEIQVGLSTVANTRARVVLAINGLDSTVVKYGAGSGDVTNGIAGITAAHGTGDGDITITADNTGVLSTIVFTDIAGTVVASGDTGASPATMATGMTTTSFTGGLGGGGAKEVIFDLWNGEASSSAGYGRLLVGYTGSVDGEGPLYAHIASGSSVWDLTFGGSTTTTASLKDTWNHIGFTFSTSSADARLETKFYLNGNLEETQTNTSLTSFGEVTGSLIGFLGSLQTAPSGNAFHGTTMAGYGKLSGSIDEFRYWKTKRTSKDVGRNWFTHVGGGSNDHIANTELGVYFKFNEGITTTTPTDSIVLDYSGRISNGNWVGYSAASRNTGSAIVSASAATSEYPDPVIYSSHPDVAAKMDSYIASGSFWDNQNTSMLYNHFPSFMQEEEEERGDQKHLRNLTQIVGSYFDELHLQIESLTKLSPLNYVSSSAKPLSMASDLLKSKGFIAPEIFDNANILEWLANRDEDRNFELELEDVKNQIYQNIYNNLVNINKSKGTEKAFRNLIRCYGVDEDLVKINLYSNNSTHLLADNYRTKAAKKTYVDFNALDRFGGSVYQQSYSGNPNTTSVTYISGTNKHLANTAEIEVVFPKKVATAEGNQNYFPTSFVSSSIFGCHTAVTACDNFTWPAAASDFGFQVYAVRSKIESKDAYFVIKDRAGNISLTSDLYEDVYDNQRWNFSVRLKNERHPVGDSVTGSIIQSSSLEFRGINVFSDVIRNDFSLTASLTSSYLTSNRRYYLGSERTNFTGSSVVSSDIRATSLRHWASYLDDGALLVHAKDPENYGSQNPSRSTYLTTTALDGTNVPQMETLALNWDFSAVTGSDAAGTFTVDDFSSGSIALRTRYPGDFGAIVGNQYAGQGMGFPASSTSSVMSDYISSARQRLPESLGGLDMINVITDAEAALPRDERPEDYYFTFEKNMYQTISEEMLNMFGTIVEFNNLIGAPVHKYRHEYKGLNKLRNLFFERIENTPDIDKYIDYYKWIDSSLSEMLQQLVPASADTSEGILNVIESHILERNKYRHKIKMVEDVDSVPNGRSLPEGNIRGYEEMNYPWRRGSAPIPTLSVAAEGTNIIDMAGAGSNNDRLKVNIPTALGGTGVDITIRVVSPADPSDGTANEVQVGLSTVANTRARVVLAINGLDSTVVKYGAGSGDVTNGIAGITAAHGTGDGDITITGDNTGLNGTTITFTDIAGTMVAAGDTGASPATMIVPLVVPEQDNCFWWKERAERDGPVITSGDSNVDSRRNTLRDRQVHHISASAPYLVTDAGIAYESSVYAARALPKIHHISSELQKAIQSRKISFVNHKKTYYKGAISFDSTAGLDITDIQSEKDCTDVVDIPAELKKTKKHFTTSGEYDERHAPFSMYSSSVDSGYASTLASDFMSGVDITNNHDDDIMTTNEIPMQGPFTERFVGGSPHRHADINHYDSSKAGTNNLDSYLDRIEGYDLDFSTGKIIVRHQEVNQPRSSYYRDGTAKRPVNIQNLKQVTGSATSTVSGTIQSPIGNFSKVYEVVRASDRATNNSSFVKAEGFGSSSTVSNHISSLNDHATPTRPRAEHIIVEKFSSPGGPASSILDLESGQFSPYNDLNTRNWGVRKPLRDLLSEKSERFGIRSGSSEIEANYDTNASFHKTNRNPVNRNEYDRVVITEIGTNIIDMAGAGSNNDRWTINVPAGIGGTGNDITIRVVSPADPSDGTANEVQVGLSTVVNTRARVVLAINGLDSTVVKYGAGSGDVTNGIAGITAAHGTGDGDITITANNSWNAGDAGTNIVFTDVAGTVVAAGDTGASPATMTINYDDETSSVVTVVTYDNWHVQHPIPRSDLQYTWISSSYLSSYMYGHADRDGLYSGSSEGVVPAILFTSASNDAVSGIKVDHLGINSLIVEPISSSAARIGYPIGTSVALLKNTEFGTIDTPAVLNSVLLHRGGIYGFSSWKQISNSYNPIVRTWRKSNTLAFNASPGDTRITREPNYETIQDRFGPLQSYIEPPVTSKNFPLRYVLDIKTSQGTVMSEIKSVYGNEIEHFTNSSLNTALYMPIKPGIAYGKMKSLYLYGALGSDLSPVTGFRSLTYKQGVFPSAQNSFLLKTRERPGYTNNFWRSSQTDRDTLGDSKFGAQPALSGNYSSWNMDADIAFATMLPSGQASATITVADGDAVSGMTEGQKITITSTSGASRVYRICEDNTTAIATGTELADGSDTGAGTTADDGDIAVVIGIATATAATAVDCIDTTGVESSSADASFTILIPTTAGGLGGTAITFLLDDSEASDPAEGANTIAIATAGMGDVAKAAKLIKAINAAADGKIDFASSGNGQAGYNIGVTAAEGSSNTQITLTNDATNFAGNLTNAITTTGGLDIVDVRSFTGGLTADTQNAFLVQLKAAIESADGHTGKITVSAVPGEANGTQSITLTQAIVGTAGNVTITEDVANTTISGFASGIDFTAGLLQNNLTHFHNGIKTNITSSVLFHRKHSVAATASVTGRTGPAATIVAHTLPTTLPLGDIIIGGGNALWEVGSQAGYYDIDGTFTSAPSYPWSDDYDEYSEELRAHNKDYSVIPEFRISEHIESYIENRGGDFLSTNPSFLSIEGASSDNPKNSSESDFYKVYSNSDFMNKYCVIREDHRGFVDPVEIKLTCKVLKKFVPYNGFYPSELMGELSTRFSSSYLDNVKFTGSDANLSKSQVRMRTFIAPFFAPGIWNNMVKSGIAVDYPIYTASFVVHNPIYSSNAAHKTNYSLLSTSSAGNADGFDLRVPFEAIISPEDYVGNTTIVDMEPHPSASLICTASWDGSGDNLYKMKAHNALASMIEFFLPGDNNKGELATLVSSEEKEWKPFKSGSVYGMRVRLRKSYTQSRQERQIAAHNYPIPQDSRVDLIDGLKENITLCSRASSFGPPMGGRVGTYAQTPTDGLHGASFYKTLDSLVGSNPGWTPGYTDGEAWSDVLYTHDTNTQPSLEYIQSKATITNWRFDEYALSSSNGGSNRHPYGFGNINKYAMQVPASINIFGKKLMPSVESGPAGNISSMTYDSTQNKNIWVIQPKMEVPIVNVNAASVTIPTYGSESVPKGVWSQFGTIPTGSEGIYLDVGDIDASWLKNRVPIYANQTTAKDSDAIDAGNFSAYHTTYNAGDVNSLADHIGFKRKTEKLGQISKSRTVKEAVVAVPFLERDGKREFFEILKEDVKISLENLAKGFENSSIDSMVSKMKEYIFPPKFDFIKYPDKITPFAMYVFEFKHEFDQDDLSYIWQGIQPLSSKTVQMSESSIKHKLLAKELMGKSVEETGEPLQPELRWMVFKVKQRAPSNYYDKVVANQPLTTGLSNDVPVGRTTVSETDVPEYSYNWPYDYFSMIEGVKIDSEVRFAATTSDQKAIHPDGTVIIQDVGGTPVAFEDPGSPSTDQAKAQQNQKDGKLNSINDGVDSGSDNVYYDNDGNPAGNDTSAQTDNDKARSGKKGKKGRSAQSGNNNNNAPSGDYT